VVKSTEKWSMVVKNGIFINKEIWVARGATQVSWQAVLAGVAVGARLFP
jgi:hypothetical protein